MEYTDKEFCLEVWGDYACFTRPEMKVERVSYDVITPSAARAIFEAIFWKPAFYWKITKLEVLNPIKWISVRRNEIGSTMSKTSKQIFIEDHRQQRAGLFLKDVKYRLFAKLVFIPPAKRNETSYPLPENLIDNEEKRYLSHSLKEEHLNENPAKYYAMFERRAKKGQCFNQPYLGCREFSAAFEYISNQEEKKSNPISDSRELGFMLYDMDFSNPEDPQAMFYRPTMQKGIILVPDIESGEVFK